MKKMRLAVVFAALLSVFGFSSCLNGGESEPSPNVWMVTVTGDRYTGFKFYADIGGILVPTTASISSFGEELEKEERLLMSYRILDENLPANPTETTQYSVSFEGGMPIDTKETIDLYNNELADSLIENKDEIGSFELMSAYKGYVTVLASFNYSGNNKLPYMNLAYNSETDVNVEDNTLNLTLYYDENTDNAYTNGKSYYSFRLPAETYGSFSSDSIKLVINAEGSGSQELKKEVNIPKTGLFPPRGY